MRSQRRAFGPLSASAGRAAALVGPRRTRAMDPRGIQRKIGPPITAVRELVMGFFGEKQ